MQSVFWECLKTATVDGLPHGAFRNTKLSRFVWTGIFIIFTALFFWHFSKIIKQFQDQATTTTTNDNQVPFIYPDMYICNGRPLSYSALLRYYNLIQTNEQDQAIQVINDIYSNLLFPNTMTTPSIEFYSLLWTSLDNELLQKAFGYFPYDNFTQSILTFTPETYFYSNMSNYVQYIQTHKHFSCFYFNMTSIANASDFTKIVFTDYVDAYHAQRIIENFANLFNNNTLEMVDYRTLPSLILGRQGYRIYFTERNVYPHDNSPFVAINPGESTVIDLRMTLSTSLSTDPMPCVANGKTETVKYVNKLSSGKTFYEYKKTQDDCRFKRAIKNITTNKNCSCIPYWLPVQMDDYLAFPTCANYTFIKNNLTTTVSSSDAAAAAILQKIRLQLKCEGLLLDFLKNMPPTDCQEESPCQQVIYAAEIQMVSLDLTASAESDIFDEINENGKYVNYTRGIETFLKEATQLTDEKERLSFYQKNFVELIIQPKVNLGSQSDQSLSYPLSNFMSDFGGIFGLYIGGSFLTVFEVLNLIWDFVDFCVRQKQRSKEEKSHDEIKE